MTGLYIVEYTLDGINKVITKKTDKSLLSFILRNSFQNNFRINIINLYSNGILHPITINTNSNGFSITKSKKGSSTIGFKAKE